MAIKNKKPRISAYQNNACQYKLPSGIRINFPTIDSALYWLGMTLNNQTLPAKLNNPVPTLHDAHW